MKTHIALGVGLLLSLTAGIAHADEQVPVPRVFLSSENSKRGVHVEELVDDPISTDENGYMLLMLSPHEQTVFSNGKLVRYLCVEGNGRQCRAQTSPPARSIASFSTLEGTTWQTMAVRILDKEFFAGHSVQATLPTEYKLTEVDGKPYTVSFDPVTRKITIRKGK